MNNDKAHLAVFATAFNEVSRIAHENSCAKGFWQATHDLINEISHRPMLVKAVQQMRRSQLRDLMYSELGEACEGDRKNLQSEKIPGFSNAEEEYADLLIRLADMNAGLGLRIAEAVVAKMAYNQGREAMHGGKAF